MSGSKHKLDALREEALDAARGLSSGESALAGVLRDLEQERSRASQAYHAVVRSLAAALEARDGYTGEHSDDVHDLSVAVAQRLGLEERAVIEVETVALLHDVGKIGIPDHILHKPGALTPEEWELMREHPVIGERILRPLPGLGAVATAVRHGHERWDGGGYPDGLAGEDIPLPSRIVLACDAFHAIVSDRPYREALTFGDACRELRDHSGTQFDPEVVEALLWCVNQPDAGAEADTRPGFADMARALTEPAQGSHAARLERELHALIAIAGIVGAADRLEDVVAVVAEQSCEAIDAASMSISRLEVEGRLVRTLVNTGELGPGEERLPADEVYRLDEDELLRKLIEDGYSYRMSVDDEDVDPKERALMEGIGKHHCVAVLIRLGGTPWGEIWAARTAGQEPFTDRDIRFLHTVAGQIAGAAGRAELFARMADLAYRDPLTGIANRRAMDERLELAVEEADAESPITVVLCDVDNLKDLNDGRGHQAGDDALERVAATLTELAGEALVARIGGDEFCVLLEGRTAAEGQAMAAEVLARLASGDGTPLTVSCGVASTSLGERRAGDLMRAADAAQYTAKRGGRARVCVADGGVEDSFRANRRVRRAVRDQSGGGTIAVAALLAGGLAALDGAYASRASLDRLEVIALAAGDAVDASATSVCWRAPGGHKIETCFTLDRRTNRSTGRRYGVCPSDFDASEYPTSTELMAAGGSVTILADDPAGDASERALLDEYGMAAVLAVGTPDGAGGDWLVEVFADGATGSLAEVADAVRLLCGEAVRGAAPAGADELRPAEAA